MVNPLDLTGKRILITGASAGIGQATAKLASELGAMVICAGRSEQGLAETQAMLAGGGHRAVQFDLSRTDEIPAWMKTLAAETGPLHGLVHSAGLNRARPLKILAHKDYADIMAINLDAAIALCRGFRQKGVCDGAGGSVVFLSSVAALKGQPSIAAYAASKGALLSLGRTLALELAREKIRVNCLCPGLVKTRMAGQFQSLMTEEAYRQVEASYPLGFGEPEDVANACVFLLSQASRWITGASLVLDGGYSA